MVKVMAVYDEDPLYAGRLAEYVNQKETFPFQAMAFSDLEKLKAYGRDHEIAILLVGERVREERHGRKDTETASAGNKNRDPAGRLYGAASLERNGRLCAKTFRRGILKIGRGTGQFKRKAGSDPGRVKKKCHGAVKRSDLFRG